MKRVISMVLCLMLVLSLATTAFAAEGDPTITVPDDGHTYEVYQIFTATLTEKDGSIVLSDVKWGTNGTLPEGAKVGDAVSQTILDKLKTVATSADNEAKLDVITKYVTLSNPIATIGSVTTGEGDEATTTKTLSTTVAPGYYLIKDKDGTVTGNDAYTTYITEIVDDVTITRKADVPEVEKKIVEGNNKVDENEASIGETIYYEFTGTLPTNIADYNTYFYKFTDTLSAGLDYVGNLKVTVEGVDVTKYFWVNATENKDAITGEKTSTTLIVSIQDLLDLENATEFAAKDITASTTVVVTYDAKLNENAIVGNNGNKNDVDLEYDNNPNDDGEGDITPPDEPKEEPKTDKPTGKTPKDEVWTYTTEVVINKVDQDNKVLTGAAFTITGEGVKYVVTTGEVYVAYAADETVDTANCYWLLNDGTYTTQDPAGKITNAEGEEVAVDTSVYADTTTKYHKETKVTIDGTAENVEVEAFVDANGQVKFTGLGAGTYTITESVVPEGYNSIPSFTVTIGWDDSTDSADDCTWSYDWSNDPENKNNTNTVTVVNQAGSTLPETGGMGTTLFYVFGSIMVLAAVVLLVTKKRMGAAE